MSAEDGQSHRSEPMDSVDLALVPDVFEEPSDAALDELVDKSRSLLNDPLLDEPLELPAISHRPMTIYDNDRDTASIYFRDVAGHGLLNAQQEVALAKIIERGLEAKRMLDESDASETDYASLLSQVDAGQVAHHQLVRYNAKLVIAMAKKYMNQGVPFLDLVQEGNLGLMKAVDKFDRNRGYRFSTYATWWVRQGITRALAEQSRTIRIPARMSDHIRRVYTISRTLSQNLGRMPTPSEIAMKMAIPIEEVTEALEIARRAVELNRRVGENKDDEKGDFVGNPVEEEGDDGDPERLAKDVETVLEALTAREARILRLRHGIIGGKPHTLKEVGKKFDLTRERIRQIEVEAYKKLRDPRRATVLKQWLE